MRRSVTRPAPASSTEMMPAGLRVGIIGGGIAGMVAAYELSKAGAAVTLLERAPRLGGLAGAFEVAPGRISTDQGTVLTWAVPSSLDLSCLIRIVVTHWGLRRALGIRNRCLVRK
jgi:choline dehydrogenase-like flavoprotein